MGRVVTVPIRTVSEANARDGWRKKSRRAQEQKFLVRAHVGVEFARRNAPPYDVTLVRIGPKKLDKDNLANSFKWVQDAVAAVLGVDDGEEDKVQWHYRQEPGGKKYAVRIEIETKEKLR